MVMVRMLGLASIADGVWQLADRKGWARFWGRSLARLRKPSVAAKAVAAGELLLGAWLAAGAMRRRSGGALRLRRAPGHHPITAA